MLENGLMECNCVKVNCARFGKCEECIEFHTTQAKLAFCKREENQPAKPAE